MKFVPEEGLLKHIGLVIKKYRKRLGMRQDKLSKKIDVTQATLSRYEKGQTNMPVLSLKKIADVCKIPIIDYFIYEETPSDMYKNLVGESDKKLSAKDEKAFDKYMSDPQNADKYELLHHASNLSHYVNDDVKNVLVETVQQTIINDKGLPKHIFAYMNELQKITKTENK